MHFHITLTFDFKDHNISFYSLWFIILLFMSCLIDYEPHLTQLVKGQGHRLFQMGNYVGTQVNTNSSMFQSQDIKPETS